MSLRLKLVLWYTGIFAVSGFLLVVSLHLLMTYRMASEADGGLEEEYREWASLTTDLLDNPKELTHRVKEEMRLESLYPLTYRLWDAKKQEEVIFLTSNANSAAPWLPIDPVPTSRQFDTVQAEDGRPYRLISGPIHPKRYPDMMLQVGMHMGRLHRRSASLRKYLFIILAVLAILATFGGWFLASRSLEPIDALAAELSRIESSKLSERLAVGPAGNEIDRLREAVNRMLGRLEGAFERLRSFTADVAHELRTPIATLQCRIEVALAKARSVEDNQQALDDALEQTSELGALVENLLLLARMDGEVALPQREAVDLGALLNDLAEPFTMLAEEKQIELAVTCGDGLVTAGDAVLLRRLFGNLLDNALRYTPDRGQVAVQAEADGETCVVCVTDTGIGIAPEALERIFERFYRADESRSRAAGGTGLGLS
ncbi:HAMP domain-containing protein, partial [bacterium]|nr:HAMP domain-containing protein [bacterium]